MKYTRKFLALFGAYSFVFFASVAVSYAATITASSCSLSDVQSAISSASSGDIVIVPAGSATWSTALSITKGITLQGAGIDSTTITSSGGSQMIKYEPETPASNEKFRLTGFTLNGNSRSVTGLYVTHNSATATLNDIRVDHNKIIGCSAEAISFNGMIYGLIDNNTLSNNNGVFRIMGIHDPSWNDPLQIGTANYLYIENNIMSNNAWMMLSGWGARWVFRYNTGVLGAIGSLGMLDAHGNLPQPGYPTCNVTGIRGVVGIEVYENTFTGLTRPTRVLDQRGGTGVVFNNVVSEAVPGTYSACNVILDVREEDDDPALDGCSPYKADYPGYDPVKDSYYFNNKYNSDRMCFVNYDQSVMIVPKQDIWVDTNSWAQTDSGYVRWGLASGRPGTCTAQDVYWESDTKKLYRCTATNTWTFIYAPYTYPHPLSLRNPSPPKNLKIASH